MTRIWKYRLEITDRQVVKMPAGGKILCAQSQYECITLWALVDDQADAVSRTILIYGTNNRGPADDERYIGTVQMADGTLVWHVFEATQ